MKFGIIGNGFIVPRHIEAIKHVGGEVMWICDKDQDYKEMPLPDYVSICTPNNLHYEMIKFFSDKGVKVLTEKPPVLTSRQIPEFHNKPVFVVLQLHYHPEVMDMIGKEFHEASVEVRVKRDQAYWDSWKGNEMESGGILFNLGVHYLDLLLYLFKNPSDNEFEIFGSEMTKYEAIGNMELNGKSVSYHFQIMPDNEGQTRELLIDGKQVQLSNQDNLSYEDLHKKVYEEMVAGRGIHIKEAFDVIRLIEDLKKWNSTPSQA